MRIDNVECQYCDALFTKHTANHLFCTPKCQLESHKKQRTKWSNTFKLKRPANQLMRSAKHRAKKHNLPFDIVETDIIIPENCPVLDIPIKVNVDSGCGGRKDSISLDRIIPEKGYVRGNIQVISHLANSMKSSATPDELLKFADWIYKTYGK